MVVEILILCINICSMKQLHIFDEGPQIFNTVSNIGVIYKKNNLKKSLHRDMSASKLKWLTDMHWCCLVDVILVLMLWM